MNKKFISYAISGVLAVSLLGSTLSVYAADNNQPNTRMQTFMSALAARFNLNLTDVQNFFKEQRVSWHLEMDENVTAKLTDRVNKAVTEGKLTQDQATKIIAKINELVTFKASLQGKTKTEIRAAVQAKITELQKWAKDNNIPTNYFKAFIKVHGMMGIGHFIED